MTLGTLKDDAPLMTARSIVKTFTASTFVDLCTAVTDSINTYTVVLS